MNLEAIALRRAAEQIDKPGSEVLWDPTWKPARKLRIVQRPKGGKAPSCECGTCRKCIKREWMRAFRAGHQKPAARRGKRMDETRRCACGSPIAATNTTGICGDCHHTHRARRIGAVAIRRGHYSHGGGI